MACCVTADIHPEGAAAAGDEETTTVSSTPPNVHRKLRKTLQACITSTTRVENLGKSTRPEWLFYEMNTVAILAL